jgi:hypothetical protein
MRQPYLIHDPLRPGVNFSLRIINKFEHKAVPYQVGRMRSERHGKLHKLCGAVVGRFDFPPQLKSEQTLIESARPLAIGDAQSNMVENSSVTTHYNLP